MSSHTAPTPAHERSQAEVIDPAYSTTCLSPPQSRSETWLYPRAEFECFLLARLRRDVDSLKLKVGYPGVFHVPAATAYFRIFLQPGVLDLNVVGDLSASLDGHPLDVLLGDGREATLMTGDEGTLLLKVAVEDPAVAIPSIQCALDGWEASTDGIHYTPATRDRAQFAMEPPAIDVPLHPLGGGRYDAGREILAHLDIASETAPRLRVGESLAEMENRDPAHAEQTAALVQETPVRWRTPLPLAFRYAAVDSDAPASIACQALYAPARYRGAFHADPELDRIWMRAAYTLRLCMHPFMLDGIKRDRLPWLGDLAISLMANAYAFADPLPVRRTLAALGRSGIKEKHLNGIVDYTLWYFICHDQHQRFFADRPFLEAQYPEIRDILDDVLRIADAHGGLLPDQGDWCFIDWSELPKATALQMLYHWALVSAARLADRMHDVATSTRCHAVAETLRDRLADTAFDDDAGLFYAIPGRPDSGFFRHPNFLAVLAEIAPDDLSTHIADELATRGMPPVGTPYMAALECLALHRGGRSADAIAEIRRIWGGMLKREATTFFEAYREGETEAETLAFYGRPYGRSLCHAWSSAPVALLPMIAFGCEPAADGWASHNAAKISVLGEACATIPAGDKTLILESRSGQVNCAQSDFR